MPISSIFSSDQRVPGSSLRRTVLVGLGCALAGWLAYAAMQSFAAGWLADRFGDSIVTAGRGRIAEPRAFLERRAWEAAWLVSCAAGLALAGQLATVLIARKVPQAWLWLPG